MGTRQSKGKVFFAQVLCFLLVLFLCNGIFAGQEGSDNGFSTGNQGVQKGSDAGSGSEEDSGVTGSRREALLNRLAERKAGKLSNTIQLASGWVTTTVDTTSSSDVGLFTSLALDPSGYAHISYYDRISKDLRYATNASGAWVTTPVDWTGNVGEYSSIALDSNTHAHISYYDFDNKNIKYATNASGSWVTSNVTAGGANDMGKYTSIAIDASNHIHISFHDNTYPSPNLMYATNVSGGWVTAVVAGCGYTSNTSLAINAAGKAHISYFDRNYVLKYATNTSGSWVTDTVATGGKSGWGKFTSIALDAAGHVHISFCNDDNNSRLKYATNASGVWVTAVVDSVSATGWHNSIKLDAAGHAHIGYYYHSHQDLKYATNATGFWETTAVDESGYRGEYASLALDTAGRIHISYYNRSNHELMYVANGFPVVSLLNINNGALTAANRTVTLNNMTMNNPTHYMASESSSFTGAVWMGYSDAPSFTLSASDGVKTVYFKVKNANGESSPVKDTIILKEVPILSTFKINNDAAETAVRTVTLNNTATGNPMLYMASESPDFTKGSWQKYSASPSFTLSSGAGVKTVYFKVKNVYGVTDVLSDTITLLGPVVSPFRINDGAADTSVLGVTLNNTATGNPTLYMASESPGFTNASWQKYSDAPSFRLSRSAGIKTVYFKVKNDVGESEVVSDTITLLAPIVSSFQINNGAEGATSRTVWLNNTATGSPTSYMASESPTFDGASWRPYNQAPMFVLSNNEGTKTVYFKVRTEIDESVAVSDTIIYENPPAVDVFLINNGDSETSSQTVTLNNTATHSPTHYMASEASDFSGASWQTYSSSPSFTLSGGIGVKTVYFKVKNAYSESAIVSDTITRTAP